MKITVSLILVLSMTFALLLTGCGDTTPTETTPTDAAPTEIVTTVATDEPTEVTTAPTETVQTTDVAEPYINDTNNIVTANEVSVRPNYVYWKDGCLYAQCFVINGYATTAHTISVESLTFANSDGTPLASAGFGTLQDLTIAPNSHVLWTFQYAPEHISNYGYDLSSLKCDYRTRNYY